MGKRIIDDFTSLIGKVATHLIVIVVLLSFHVDSFAGQFKVTRVVDGDTIKVSGNGKTITIRLVGIDAPESSKKKNEPGQPFSRKSTKYLASLVLNKSVTVQSYGSDRYGRTLGVANGMKNGHSNVLLLGSHGGHPTTACRRTAASRPPQMLSDTTTDTKGIKEL